MGHRDTQPPAPKESRTVTATRLAALMIPPKTGHEPLPGDHCTQQRPDWSPSHRTNEEKQCYLFIYNSVKEFPRGADDITFEGPMSLAKMGNV